LAALSRDLADSARQAGRNVVTVRGRRGLPSSGVHWKRGVIITADHTLERDNDIRIELPDGDTVRAVLVGRNPDIDLAVLEVPSAAGLPTAQLGDAASMKVGHMVLAIARPGDRGLSASWGVISGFDRHGPNRVAYLDVTIYPGFSGGPLIGAKGRMIGMNSLGTAGAAYCIPNAPIARAVDELLGAE
jgi:S1-C subfamily serine protease